MVGKIKGELIQWFSIIFCFEFATVSEKNLTVKYQLFADSQRVWTEVLCLATKNVTEKWYLSENQTIIESWNKNLKSFNVSLNHNRNNLSGGCVMIKSSTSDWSTNT